MTYLFLAGILFASAGTAAAALALYRRLPSSWLCEFDEAPAEMHRPENRCRQPKRAFVLMTAVAAMAFCAAADDVLYTAPSAELTGAAYSYMTVRDMAAFFTEITDISFICNVLFAAAAAVLLMAAALSDADYCIIPDQLCAAVLLLSAARAFAVNGAAGAGTSLLGGLACGGMMLLAALAGRLVSGSESTGTGDVKLLGACGVLAAAASGPDGWLAAAASVFVCAVLSSAVWFALLLILKRAHYGDARPMGPWIAASALLTTCSLL